MKFKIKAGKAAKKEGSTPSGKSVTSMPIIEDKKILENL